MEHFRDLQKAIRSMYLRRMAAAEMFKEGLYLIATVHGNLAEKMHELYATRRGGLTNNHVTEVIIKEAISEPTHELPAAL